MVVSKSPVRRNYYNNINNGGVEEASVNTSRVSKSSKASSAGSRKDARKVGKDVSYNSIKNLVHQALIDQQRQDQELLRGYYLTSNGSIASSHSKKSTSTNRSRHSRKINSNGGNSKSIRRRSKSPGYNKNMQYQRFENDNYDSDCEDAIETVLREPSNKKKKKKSKKQHSKTDNISSSSQGPQGETSKPSPPTVPQQQQQQQSKKIEPDQQQEAQEQSNENSENSVLIDKATVQTLLQSLATQRRDVVNQRASSPAPETTTTTIKPAASHAQTTPNTDAAESVVKSSLENILRSIDMDTTKRSTVEKQRHCDALTFHDCASVSNSIMSNSSSSIKSNSSSSIKSILKNANSTTPPPERTESAFAKKRVTKSNTKANAKTSVSTVAAATEIGGTNGSGIPKRSLFGTFLKRKAGQTIRMSACGAIETVVYQKNPDDGSEKAYVGKLRKCPTSPERMVLELSPISKEDDANNKNSTKKTGSNLVALDGRQDIETGILRCNTAPPEGRQDTENGILRRNYEQQRQLSDGRVGPAVVTGRTGTSTNNTREKVPILADDCPGDSPWNGHCGGMECFGAADSGQQGQVQVSGVADDDNSSLLGSLSCNNNDTREEPTSTSTTGLDAMQHIKKVRFSFDESSDGSNNSNNSGVSDRSTKHVNNNSSKHRSKRSRKLSSARPRIPWPLTNASILDDDDDSTVDRNNPVTAADSSLVNKKIQKVCLIGISTIFAIVIIGLLAGLSLFFLRAYRSEEGFWGGGGRDGGQDKPP